MMRILSTKLLGDDVVAFAQSEGVELICMELIKTIPVDFDRSFLTAAKNDAVIFTSSSAVKSVFENKEALHMSKPVYALSGKTIDELSKYGISVAGTADDSDRLADVVMKQRSITSVLHICGNIALDTLQQKFKKAIITYTRLVVYRTALLDRLIDEQYDAVMFFSPSGIDSFLKKNEPDKAAVYSCIGTTTAGWLKSKYDSLDIVIADKPDPQQMITQIITHRKLKNING